MTMGAQAARGAAGQKTKRSILVFDDQSAFEYLLDFDLPGIHIEKCKTFEDLDYYLTHVRIGEIPPPAILAIDVYCGLYPDFSMFDVKVPLDPNTCGFQLYEYVLRPVGEAFRTANVIFFTSFSSQVGDIAVRRLSQQYNLEMQNCARVEFREKLVELTVNAGLVQKKEAEGLRHSGLSQHDYTKLFKALADEFELTAAEQCSFVGLVDGYSKDVDALLEMTTLANEKIDLAVAISVLLDRLLDQADKRKFLQAMEPIGDGRRGFDLLVSGTAQDLLSIKRAIEHKIGGEIL